MKTSTYDDMEKQIDGSHPWNDIDDEEILLNIKHQKQENKSPQIARHQLYFPDFDKIFPQIRQ